MLAGLFLDIVVVAIFVIMIIIGIKQGYRGTVVHTILIMIIVIAGAAGIGYLTAEFIAPISGASKGIEESVQSIVGENNAIMDLLPLSAEEMCKWITFGIFFIIGFIIGLILVGVLAFLIIKLLNKLRNFTWYRIIDNTVAVIINVSFYLVILLAILGFIHIFEVPPQSGAPLLVNFREFLKSTWVTKFLYESDLNFFSKIFENFELAEIFYKVFS